MISFSIPRSLSLCTAMLLFSLYVSNLKLRSMACCSLGRQLPVDGCATQRLWEERTGDT
jgi:hypothetical protein